MNKKNFTKEQIENICKDYADKSKSVTEIARKYDIAESTLVGIVRENGGTQRVVKKKSPKVCSRCHKSIKVSGAKYCPFCGADIRTEKDILTERITKIYSLAQLLPVNERENYEKTISDVLKYIKEN